MAPNPLMPTSEIPASVPPANITSARPRRIASIASPIAMLEAAQAVHCDASGPRVPSSIETQAAPMFGMIAVIESGLTRSGPRVTSVEWHSSKLCRPPIPVATEAPVRSVSPSTSTPESASAILAAASTICEKRSIRRALRCSIQLVGSKPLSSQANVTGYSLASKSVIGPAPLFPAVRFSQKLSAVFPSGVTAPTPVTTTRRRPLSPAKILLLHPQAAVDEQDLTRHEPGLVRTQKAYRTGNVLRCPEPTERRIPED